MCQQTRPDIELWWDDSVMSIEGRPVSYSEGQTSLSEIGLTII
jgi:hypothetical protein